MHPAELSLSHVGTGGFTKLLKPGPADDEPMLNDAHIPRSIKGMLQMLQRKFTGAAFKGTRQIEGTQTESPDS